MVNKKWLNIISCHYENLSIWSRTCSLVVLSKDFLIEYVVHPIIVAIIDFYTLFCMLS